MTENYSSRSPGVKRLMREAAELSTPTEEYCAYPLENNLFEWHFTIRGCVGTDFEGGFYHGRIQLPSNYPMSPPVFIFTTPNGRFEIDKKICLSISEHHPETWQPSWSIRTALTALIAFMPTPGNGTIGSLDYTSDERKKLAKKSQSWTCTFCGPIQEKLLNSFSKGHVLGRPTVTTVNTSEDTVAAVINEKPAENDEPQQTPDQCESPVAEIRTPIENPVMENVVAAEARNKRIQLNFFIALIILLIAVLLYRRWKIDRLLFL